MSTIIQPEEKTFLTMYLTALATNPLRTKAITSGVLSGLQEFLAQKLAGQKTKKGDIIDPRVIQMAAYGFLISGPLNHTLFEILNRFFKGKTGTQAKIAQILASNLLITPITNSVYLAAMAIIAGARSQKQVIAAVRQNLFSLMRISWVISPLSMVFAQKFLDPIVWVPFFNSISFAFGLYINTTNKRKLIQQQKRQAEKRE